MKRLETLLQIHTAMLDFNDSRNIRKKRTNCLIQSFHKNSVLKFETKRGEISVRVNKRNLAKHRFVNISFGI